MTTWVLLRGLTREARHWGAFVPTLQARLPGARIVAIDLPGNGLRHAETSPTRVEAMADDCRRELQRLRIDGPVQLLAMSLGAMVALAWADRHPHDVAGLLLVNTSLRRFSPPWQRLRAANWAALLRLLLSSPTDAEWEAAVLRLTTRHRHDEVLDDWTRWRASHPVSRANALRQLWAAAHYRAPADAPAVPLRLLASRGDGLVDPRCSQALAARWGCPLVWHPSAGHDLPLDDAAWVADQAALLTI